MTILNDIQVWTTACAYDRLIPGRGVGVLLDDGTQAALFRLDDGSVHAVGNIDPDYNVQPVRPSHDGRPGWSTPTP